MVQTSVDGSGHQESSRRRRPAAVRATSQMAHYRNCFILNKDAIK